MAMVPQIPGPPQPMPGTLAPNFLPQPGGAGPVPGMPMLPSTAPPVPGGPVPGMPPGPAAPQQTNAPNPMLLMALLQKAAQEKKASSGGTHTMPNGKKMANSSMPAKGSPDALVRAMQHGTPGKPYGDGVSVPGRTLPMG